MKVWVVMKSCGEYSDSVTDIDSVWSTETQALARAHDLEGMKASFWEMWRADIVEMAVDQGGDNGVDR